MNWSAINLVDMSVPLTPSKRPHDRNLTESNGKGKWQKTHKQSVKFAPGSVVLRLLCPASKTGGVIGKVGNIISEIRQETGAKVRVEETVPGCDKRVVVISGSDKEIEVTTEASQEDGGEETNMDEKNDDEKEHNENNEDKEFDAVGDAKSDKGTLAVQKALFLVFERIIEGELETDGGDEDDNKSSSIVFRLLVLSNQVGCLLLLGWQCNQANVS
ncbi:KH domain-containing protein HEN4-like [Quercus lobata]|uniref:KH domain-containing protein HEN4-like n=1 Tax=Quercus lobata TaxID=97700 RepID=UPI001247404B|nr:KH domain-containing protein HEN4-like [Quercus lobata]